MLHVQCSHKIFQFITCILYYLIANCSRGFKNCTKFISRKLNWEMIWIDACPHYTKMYTRGNKKLSNLGVHFGVKAVHHLRYCGFGPLRTNQARLARNSERLWTSAKVLASAGLYRIMIQQILKMHGLRMFPYVFWLFYLLKQLQIIVSYCHFSLLPPEELTEGRLWTARLGGPIVVLQPQLTTFNIFFLFQMAQ